MLPAHCLTVWYPACVGYGARLSECRHAAVPAVPAVPTVPTVLVVPSLALGRIGEWGRAARREEGW